MNILVASSNQYVKALRIMLASLFQHETEHLNIYLIYSSVTEKNRALLRSFIEEQGGCFFPVRISGEMFQDASLPFHFAKEVYYRIWCSELLPDTVERVLYLDSDIIIRKSIKPLYEMDFQGKSLIGMRDAFGEYFREEHWNRLAGLGLSKEDTYINSGVLLFNLVKMRQTFVATEFLCQMEKLRSILRYADQDMINVFFKGKIGFADLTYNYPSVLFNASDMLRWWLGGWKKESPCVVHYMGKIKPWQTNYIGKYYFEYRKYYKEIQSPGERIFFEIRRPGGIIGEIIKGFFRVTARKIKKMGRK